VTGIRRCGKSSLLKLMMAHLREQGVIEDHVTIGDRVCIGSKSGLDKDVPDGEVRFGYPALPGMQYHRASAIFKNLPDLARRVSQAEKEIAALKEK
jgi:UDP-3-O-[3-hydroxymyristoyl] glucosamine N-acyltransferase